tara:strand:- start:173 stop:526 length:354 start_codon:yes stop_codon:yes gene_type:complete
LVNLLGHKVVITEALEATLGLVIQVMLLPFVLPKEVVVVSLEELLGQVEQQQTELEMLSILEEAVHLDRMVVQVVVVRGQMETEEMVQVQEVVREIMVKVVQVVQVLMVFLGKQVRI